MFVGTEAKGQFPPATEHILEGEKPFISNLSANVFLTCWACTVASLQIMWPISVEMSFHSCLLEKEWKAECGWVVWYIHDE